MASQAKTFSVHPGRAVRRQAESLRSMPGVVLKLPVLRMAGAGVAYLSVHYGVPRPVNPSVPSQVRGADLLVLMGVNEAHVVSLVELCLCGDRDVGHAGRE